jgi:hypothetical protein
MTVWGRLLFGQFLGSDLATLPSSQHLSGAAKFCRSSQGGRVSIGATAKEPINFRANLLKALGYQ